jgi:hypothetical protein
MRRMLGLFVGVVLGGCGSEKLDVGSQGVQQADGGLDAGQVVMGKPGPTNESCENGPQLPILGKWDGYIENQTWVSGSDAVHVTITNANDTLVCGTVVLGDGPPPAPIVDRHPAYPDDGRFAPSNLPTRWDDQGTLVPFAEDFVLTLANSKVAPPRIQFGANWVLPWKDWCELQPPVPSIPYQYQCDIRDDAPCTDPATGMRCGRELLCTEVCVCTADKCSAGERRDDTLPCNWLDFDLRFEGSAANGSMKLGCTSVNNVHLLLAP